MYCTYRAQQFYFFPFNNQDNTDGLAGAPKRTYSTGT